MGVDNLLLNRALRGAHPMVALNDLDIATIGAAKKKAAKKKPAKKKKAKKAKKAKKPKKKKKAKKVSKKASAASKKKLGGWLAAVAKARKALGTKGFVAIKKGSPLYTKAKSFYKR